MFVCACSKRDHRKEHVRSLAVGLRENRMWGARSRAKWFEVSEGIQRARRTTGATGMADGSKPAHKARSEGVAGSRAGWGRGRGREVYEFAGDV